MLLIARSRKSQENYKQLGGSFPLRDLAGSQAQSLQQMGYGHPFPREIVARMKWDKPEKLVIVLGYSILDFI